MGVTWYCIEPFPCLAQHNTCYINTVYWANRTDSHGIYQNFVLFLFGMITFLIGLMKLAKSWNLPLIHIMFNIIQPQSHLYWIAFTTPMKNIFHFSSSSSSFQPIDMMSTNAHTVQEDYTNKMLLLLVLVSPSLSFPFIQTTPYVLNLSNSTIQSTNVRVNNIFEMIKIFEMKIPSEKKTQNQINKQMIAMKKKITLKI